MAVCRKYIVFNGRWYCRDARTGYYLNSTTRKMLHRAVWEHHNGPIPEGHEIHHKHGNKHNNDIENLDCMTVADHKMWHREHMPESQKAHLRAIAKKGNAAATAWHRSPEGLAWHRTIKGNGGGRPSKETVSGMGSTVT